MLTLLDGEPVQLEAGLELPVQRVARPKTRIKSQLAAAERAHLPRPLPNPLELRLRLVE
jgi:hypothetical protein